MEDFSAYLRSAHPEDIAIRSRIDPEELFSSVDEDLCDSLKTIDKNICSPLFDFGEKLTLSPLIETKVFEVEKDVHKETGKCSIHDDIADLEWSIDKCHSQIKENGIKDMIIAKQYKKNSLVLKKIEEITKKLNEKLIHCKNNNGPSKQTYYARDLRFEDGTSCTETSCMRSVRESCEAISSFFDKEFAKEVNLPSTPDNSTNTSQFWTKAEDILHGYSPSEIHEAILKNIQQTTEKLKELSSQIDLKRDAENLKFKFETGKLKDISSEPALLKTVRQQIEMMQVSHFQRFIACEKANNEASDLRKKLQTLNTEIDIILKEKFDVQQAELIKKYFHAEVEHGSCISTYHFLQEELNRLHTEQKEKEATMEVLMKKYEKIQNFDKTVQAKQLVIQKLIQINGSAKSQHRQEHAEVTKLVENKIIQKQDEIFDLCEKYKNLCGEELDIFRKIPIQNLNCIKHVNGDRKLVSDLSINYLSPQFQHPGDDSIKHILKKVEIPAYSAPENIISDIIGMKHNCYKNSEKALSFSIKGKELADIHTKISNQTERLSKLYKEQFEALMPCVKDNKEKTSEIMTAYLKFKNAAQTWWQQPAQTLVPWMTVDGLNIQQYLDQFSTHGELLKQMRDGTKTSKLP